MEKISEDKVVIRDADKSDNEGLLSLAASSGMRGKFSFRVERKPDFFRLLQRKGNYLVKVAVMEGRIVGSVSVVEMDIFIGCKSSKAYYACDFRVHPDYRGSGLGVRLVQEIYHQSVSQGAELFFGVMLLGNREAASYLSGKLRAVPPIVAGSVFRVFQIIPSATEIKSSKYRIETVDDFRNELFSEEMKQYSFAHDYPNDIYKDTRIWCAAENGVVVAAIALAASEEFKQEVLVDVPGYLKSLMKLAEQVKWINSRMNLPRLNGNIRVLYIRSFYGRDEHQEALRILIAHARNQAYKQQYHFLTVGIDERSKYLRFFSSFPKFTLKSRLYFCNSGIAPDVFDALRQGVSFVDYSLV
ncbi:MAG TPA: GNAT family N-acetyltransferase [Paludibacteraceae bacterium]|nr:GNAT family N-acetyltransferase [Paludibacteraceae bacterium]